MVFFILAWTTFWKAKFWDENLNEDKKIYVRRELEKKKKKDYFLMLLHVSSDFRKFALRYLTFYERSTLVSVFTNEKNSEEELVWKIKCEKRNSSSLYVISAYEKFHRSSLFSKRGENLSSCIVFIRGFFSDFVVCSCVSSYLVVFLSVLFNLHNRQQLQARKWVKIKKSVDVNTLFVFV